MNRTPFERYTPEPNTGCWLWTGYCGRNGYGRGSFFGVARDAHRAFYGELLGKVPSGLELDHACRVRSCVNPAHLTPVTHAENVRMGLSGAKQRARTHCPHGHEYSKGNTYVSPAGARGCRVCRSIRSAARNVAFRAAPPKEEE